MSYEPIANFMTQAEPVPENGALPAGKTEALSPVPEKDFDTWNARKKVLECSGKNISCKPRDVWWCSLGLNIGNEQDGKNEEFERPVLIIRTLSKDTSLCVPLTSSPERHFFRISLPSFSTEAKAVISQIRTISNKRLLRYAGIVSPEDCQTIKEALHKLIRTA